MKHFLWVDLEMTGLDDLTDRILEIAAVVTDLELKPVESFHRVVQQPQQVLDSMNDWCKKTHGESGLSALVPTGTPLATVETEVLQLLDRYFPVGERIVLCGNSVGNDKRFIDRYLLQVAKRLHYRLIDVSSFKEVFREKYGLSFQKANAHRAIDDVFESIRELSFYLSYVNVQKS
jgi:oligoribonuclease